MYVSVPQFPRKPDSPESREPSHGCWDSNPSPSEEQPALSIAAPAFLAVPLYSCLSIVPSHTDPGLSPRDDNRLLFGVSWYVGKKPWLNARVKSVCIYKERPGKAVGGVLVSTELSAKCSPEAC